VSLRENLQFRAAWSQTVVRPTYREFADVFVYDPATSRVYLGNPDLVITDSENYDLRVDWFPRVGEVVSLSLFMKQIANPIEVMAEDSQNLKYVNSPSADVYGAELEFRTRLDNFWQPLANFSLGINAAYIISEVPIDAGSQQQRENTFGNSDDTRPLFDQPEYVLNSDLTWELARTGTSITLSGGVVGRRLISYSISQPDEYEEPAPQLDVFLSQKLGKHWKLKLSAKNLLNPTYDVTQTYESPVGNGDPFVTERYTKGITYGLSLSCEF